MRLHAKQGLLDTLVLRARDISAYTRATVLRTWGSLATSESIPLGHWSLVTDMAVGDVAPASVSLRPMRNID